LGYCDICELLTFEFWLFNARSQGSTGKSHTSKSSVLVSDFNYHLPPELIAQHPLADRAAARMLHVVRPAAGLAELLADRNFRDLPGLLRPSDLLVLNNTRVFPARLYGRRAGVRSLPVSRRNRAARDFLKGQVEVLLTKQVAAHPPTWQALVRPGRKIGIGERLFFGGDDEPQLQAEVIARGEFGERALRFEPVPDFFGALERLGHVPLPPYIGRGDDPGDRERYQTVFARERGSVAAPTAGLHFTPEILSAIRNRGIEIAAITLHVGLGTFQPVHEERVEEHRLHSEWFQVPVEAAAAILRAREAGRRIVAVGTTVVRTLEYAALFHGNGVGAVQPCQGEADLFIYPGFEFKVVGAMLTNFHLPESTLLMLVAGFAGRERTLKAYEHAVCERYRFYSYGDCMFIE
jgi:S-adenosylmethionine:tRNA ribosyltransferase-isomerase